MKLQNEIPGRGWVLYDDSCGFCRTWVPFWAPTLRKRGYVIAPLQCEWAGRRLGLSREIMATDLRLLLVDGSQVQGSDVYRHVMRRIWWAYPLFLLSCVPGLRSLFDLAYRTFATQRFRFSRACGLSGHVEPYTRHDVKAGLSHR